MANQKTEADRMVLVSKTGDFIIDRARARAVASKIAEGARYIAIDGAMLSTHAIDGILPYGIYRENARIKRRGYICEYDKYHRADDQCACSALAAMEKPRLPEGDRGQTPEQQARIKATIEWHRRTMGTPDHKDTMGRDIYIERRAAEILAETAPDAAGEPQDTKTTSYHLARQNAAEATRRAILA